MYRSVISVRSASGWAEELPDCHPGAKCWNRPTHTADDRTTSSTGSTAWTSSSMGWSTPAASAKRQGRDAAGRQPLREYLSTRCQTSTRSRSPSTTSGASEHVFLVGFRGRRTRLQPCRSSLCTWPSSCSSVSTRCPGVRTTRARQHLLPASALTRMPGGWLANATPERSYEGSGRIRQRQPLSPAAAWRNAAALQPRPSGRRGLREGAAGLQSRKGGAPRPRTAGLRPCPGEGEARRLQTGGSRGPSPTGARCAEGRHRTARLRVVTAPPCTGAVGNRRPASARADDPDAADFRAGRGRCRGGCGLSTSRSSILHSHVCSHEHMYSHGRLVHCMRPHAGGICSGSSSSSGLRR